METFEVLSLMLSFGMFVIAVLEFKDKGRILEHAENSVFFQREDKEKTSIPFVLKISAKHRQHPFIKGTSEHMEGLSLWQL